MEDFPPKERSQMDARYKGAGKAQWFAFFAHTSNTNPWVYNSKSTLISIYKFINTKIWLRTLFNDSGKNVLRVVVFTFIPAIELKLQVIMIMREKYCPHKLTKMSTRVNKGYRLLYIIMKNNKQPDEHLEKPHTTAVNLSTLSSVIFNYSLRTKTRTTSTTDGERKMAAKHIQIRTTFTHYGSSHHYRWL